MAEVVTVDCSCGVVGERSHTPEEVESRRVPDTEFPPSKRGLERLAELSGVTVDELKAELG